jgi:hypothetical protein
LAWRDAPEKTRTVATVVSVMDRRGWGANTDNIVVVDPARRTLTWIPRDLWSPMLGNRINTAFRHEKHATLRAALAEHGVYVSDGLCLQREAVANALRDVSVEIPVPKQLRFWYPLEPEHDIQDGRKLVEFDAPSEVLRGERIHQWIGARYDVAGVDGSDLTRIRRQQVLVRRLLEDAFDFSRALADPKLVSITGDGALDDLGGVNAQWHFAVMDDNLVVETIDGKSVLVRVAPRNTTTANNRPPSLPRRITEGFRSALGRSSS